jgi:glyoxylase-like metal-dependent hydrolase (beta-lactamase superfamily II)
MGIMKARHLLGVALILLLFGLPGGVKPQTALPDRPYNVHDQVIKVARISDRIVVVGTLEVNVTAIRSDQGLVLVDSHRSPTSMEAVLLLVGMQLGTDRVTHVINTHGDWDHTAGNQVFPEAEIVGHASCPEHMRRSPADTYRTIWGVERSLGSQHPESGDAIAWNNVLANLRNEYTVTPPTTLVHGRLVLETGGLQLILIDCAGGHSVSDIVVYVPSERLVVTGDIACSSASPCFSVNAMTDVPRIIAAIDEVLAAGVDTVIRGHGPALTGAELRTFRNSLVSRFSRHEERAELAGRLPDLISKAGATNALRQLGSQAAREGPLFTDEELDRLAWNLFVQGRADQAIDLLEASLGLYPESGLLYDSLADLELRSGNLEAARASFQRALELNQWNGFARAMLEQLK